MGNGPSVGPEAVTSLQRLLDSESDASTRLTLAMLPSGRVKVAKVDRTTGAVLGARNMAPAQFGEVEELARSLLQAAPGTPESQRLPIPTLHLSDKSAVALDEFDDRTCSVCLDARSDVMLHACMHTFCNSCITQWAARAKRDGDVASCPVCRSPLGDVEGEGVWCVVEESAGSNLDYIWSFVVAHSSK